jgi:hypothetical protein
MGIAWGDLGRGLILATDLSREAARDLISRLEPAELIHSDARTDRVEVLALLGDQPWLMARPDWHFEESEAARVLCTQFVAGTMAGFGFDDRQPCLRAAGALVTYLRETVRTGLPHLELRPHSEESLLRIDGTTRRSLEIAGNQRDGGREGSLLTERVPEWEHVCCASGCLNRKPVPVLSPPDMMLLRHCLLKMRRAVEFAIFWPILATCNVLWRARQHSVLHPVTWPSSARL